VPFISLTKIHGWDNFFLIQLSALALSPSYREVGGRFFCLARTPFQAVESRSGRAELRKRNNRIDCPPAERIDTLERATHAANAIRARNTTGFHPGHSDDRTGRANFRRCPIHAVRLASKLCFVFGQRVLRRPFLLWVLSCCLLTLNVISGPQNPTSSAFIDFWTMGETAYLTSRDFGCWDRMRLDELDSTSVSPSWNSTMA
jgi:hypothetical protein